MLLALRCSRHCMRTDGICLSLRRSLAEVGYLLAREAGPRVEALFLRSLADCDFTAVDLTPADFARMADLVVTYGDLPLGTTDAAVVAVAERLKVTDVATLIRRNPCRIDGAGKEDSDERSVIPLPVVFVIADKLPRRYRALVLLATFAQLRLGELASLTRNRLDLATCQVRVTDAKSPAGNRTVTFPAEIMPELREHLRRYASSGPKGLVFIGPKGGILRRNNFNPIWRKACVIAGAPDAHFHDLRHTGGTLAGTTGATIKELMARLGHSSPRAAMIYQHATGERDKTIADGLGQLLRDAQTPTAHSE
jgi:integrase